ncbi:uncharacterized protein DS421_4g126290 [Arachis hypogaea]|nr:uncharacterized protein DS421_4g126290 [Arachis hypogaea]
MEWWVSMPKVELHAHLNGSIRDSTLLELTKALGDASILPYVSDNLERANGQIFNVENPDNEVSVKELVELMIQVATIAWLKADSVCGSHSVAILLVLVLPYLFRLNQCLRQYKDTGEKTCLLNVLELNFGILLELKSLLIILIGRLGGGGSDYKPFVQHVGIPSIDIAFGGEFLVPKREASVRISLCQNFLYIKNDVVSSNLTP